MFTIDTKKKLKSALCRTNCNYRRDSCPVKNMNTTFVMNKRIISSDACDGLTIPAEQVTDTSGLTLY